MAEMRFELQQVNLVFFISQHEVGLLVIMNLELDFE